LGLVSHINIEDPVSDSRIESNTKMPTYQYICDNCHTEMEVIQSFSDDALTDCQQCSQTTLRRVISATGVIFKGGGWYKTDSRTGSSKGKSGKESDTATTKDSDSKPESGPEGGWSSEKATSTPEPTPSKSTPKKD